MGSPTGSAARELPGSQTAGHSQAFLGFAVAWLKVPAFGIAFSGYSQFTGIQKPMKN
jgi:hypothetical protein